MKTTFKLWLLLFSLLIAQSLFGAVSSNDVIVITTPPLNASSNAVFTFANASSNFLSGRITATTNGLYTLITNGDNISSNAVFTFANSASNTLRSAITSSTNVLGSMAYQNTNNWRGINGTNINNFNSGGVQGAGVYAPNDTAGSFGSAVAGASSSGVTNAINSGVFAGSLNGVDGNQSVVVGGQSGRILSSNQSILLGGNNDYIQGSLAILFGAEFSEIDGNAGYAQVRGSYIRNTVPYSIVDGMGTDSTHRYTNTSPQRSYTIIYGTGKTWMVTNNYAEVTGNLAVTNGTATFFPKPATAITGTVDPTASTNVTGVGTLFTSELSPGDRISINNEIKTVLWITNNTTLVTDKAFTDTAAATVYRLSPIVKMVGTNTTPTAPDPKFIVQDTGNVGIGILAPATLFHVGAGVGSFSIGDGTGSTFTPNIGSSNPSGTAGVAASVADGTNNRRVGFFVNDTSNVVGFAANYSANRPSMLFISGSAELARFDNTSGLNFLVGTNATTSAAKFAVHGNGYFNGQVTANSYIGAIFSTNASTAFSTNWTTLFVDSASGAVLITLPSAVGNGGRSLEIIDFTGNAGANNITVTNSGGQLISGANSKVISANYAGYRVVSNNTNWFGRAMSP